MQFGTFCQKRAFAENAKMFGFGFSCTAEDGHPYFLGLYPATAETLKNAGAKADKDEKGNPVWRFIPNKDAKSWLYKTARDNEMLFRVADSKKEFESGFAEFQAENPGLNRGHYFEKLIVEQFNAKQPDGKPGVYEKPKKIIKNTAFWHEPDVTFPDGLTVQCKAERGTFARNDRQINYAVEYVKITE